jgi:predicted nucleic acid-binding protein
VITAIDTSVLLDVFGADDRFGQSSAAAVRECLARGSLVACEVVWAETSAYFPTAAHAQEALDGLRVDYSRLDMPASLLAGEHWRRYRGAGGTRERVIADFMIGAHARTHSDQLLTRDRGFYRTYFDSLPVVDPSEA